MGKVCSIEGCLTKTLARGWCSKHLSRFYKTGSPHTYTFKTTCEVEHCGRKHYARGMCSRHFEVFRRKSGYKASTERKVSTRYTMGRYTAKRRGLSWELTLEEFSSLIREKCHYCSGPLPQTRTGLDRKDSSRGYSYDNVVPCCLYCNQIKSNKFGYLEFLELSRAPIFIKVLSRIHHLLPEKDFSHNGEDNRSQ